MLANQEEEQWTSASFFCNSSHNHDVVYVIKYHIQLSAYLYTKNVLIDTYINTRKYLLRLGSQKNIKRVGNFNRPLKNSATLYIINPYMPEFLFCSKLVSICWFGCVLSVFIKDCAMAAISLYLEHGIVASQIWDARTERVGVLHSLIYDEYRDRKRSLSNFAGRNLFQTTLQISGHANWPVE